MAAFSLRDIISEFRRRRVFGTIVLYVVGAWVLLQVAALVFAGLDIPETSIRYVLIGTILGLPVALVFGWRFDMTTRGVRRTPTAGEDTIDLSLTPPDYIVLFVLSITAIVIVSVLTQKILQTKGVFERTNAVAELPEFDPPEFSIAVLPFDNLSSDPEQEYFVGGMHDALIAELQRIGDLFVISRTSTLQYKETTSTIPEIARELKVAMIVEGSVLKANDQIRVQIQLVDARSDRHLLAQTYDRELIHVLDLQSEVTQDIAERIKVSLTKREQSRFAGIRSVNPQAYESYLRGKFFADQFTSDSLAKALKYFEQAIALDPDDPLPYAGMASAYIWISVGHGSIPPSIAFPRAREAFNKALQIDATLAEAHYVSGHLSLFLWDWTAAEREFQRAIELKPSSADAHNGYATYLQATQQYDEAIQEIYLAAQLDPLSPIRWADVAVNLYAAKHYERGITEANKALELNPDFAPALWILGELYLISGMHEKAIATLQHATAIQPNFKFDLAQAYATAGRISEARAILDDGTPESKLDAYKMSEVFAVLGEVDQVFEKLEIAYEGRVPWLFIIRYDRVFDDLRTDPRYIDLIQRMNFPEPGRP